MAKILLVDDAAFMRKVIKDTLSKAGYTDLHEAVDGADAVEKYNSLKPDLVLMDITMPNMDGLEALKAIRAADANANITGVIGAVQDTITPEAKADLFANVQNVVTGAMTAEDAVASAIAVN